MAIERSLGWELPQEEEKGVKLSSKKCLFVLFFSFSKSNLFTYKIIQVKNTIFWTRALQGCHFPYINLYNFYLMYIGNSRKHSINKKKMYKLIYIVIIIIWWCYLGFNANFWGNSNNGESTLFKPPLPQPNHTS